MKPHFTILATMLAASPLLGAQTNENNEQAIESISILGTHSAVAKPLIAGSVSVLTEAEIQASGAVTITDLLRTVAGVNVSQSGALGSLTELRFRGSESNHVMVLVDGIEINDTAQGSLADLTHLVLANVERIEVLRGPQSAMWGSNAIAGIISITTKQASSNTAKPTVGLSIGDRATYQANASVSQQLDKLSFAISANLLKTDGANASREGDEKDGYKNTSLVGRVAYQLNDEHALQFNARYVDYLSEFDSFNFVTGLIADANNDTKGEQVSTRLDWRYNPSNKDNIYSQLLSFQYNEQEALNFTDDLLISSNKGSKLRVLWNNRFELGKNSWISAGLEGVDEQFSQSSDPSNYSNSSYSFVSSAQYAATSQINLSASFRYDTNDEFKDASSYRIGSTYIVNNDWHVFASYGKAIKNPTFTERYSFFPAFFVGNPDLSPEEQSSVELGFEGNFTYTNLQVSWFKADLESEILGFVFVPELGLSTALNATNDSTREGVEISTSTRIDKLEFKTQYAYLDSADASGTPELRRARHTGSVSGSYRFNNQHNLYLQADYTGTRLDVLFPDVLPLEAFWLVSANYRYQYSEKMNINLRISNVFNKRYEDVIGYRAQSSRVLFNLQYAW